MPRRIRIFPLAPSLGLLLGLSFALTGSGVGAAEAADGFEPTVQPFFKTYCLRCHDGKKQSGDFRLDSLPRDFADLDTAQRWAEVLFRMNSGEMPPKDEPQPKPDELGQVVDWLSSRIRDGEAARMARRGPVAHYRLSREEYGHTMYDLLGVYYDVQQPGALNEDPRWHGFERVGSLLSLSPSHVERYFTAADVVLSRAFPLQPPKMLKGRREAKAGREAGQPPARWLLWPGRSQPLFKAESPGLYRIRVQLSALPSFKGRLPHLALWDQGLKRSATGVDVLAPEDQPTVVEFETFLAEGSFQLLNESPGMLTDGHTLSHTNPVFTHTKAHHPGKPTGYKLFDEEGRPIFPLLIVDWVEYEGPILLESDQRKRADVFPVNPNDRAEVLASLRRFATRAWRKPATDAELDRYVRILDGELASGEKFPLAYRAALAGLLTSKNFLYLEEGSPAAPRGRVNDWELAARLSYFLWSSLPDASLAAAAESGALHRPETLKAQLDRMLDDPKIERFLESFPRQWLQLHRVGAFPPDPALYPDYDKWLERSMVLETTEYFGQVFRGDLSIGEFLDSDWTMLNPRLAMHYGLPPLRGAGFQKVPLRPEDHRGGLLTQASILSLTSDGTRHRPVHRGVWVSEAVFGRTPPPPPPNVEPLEPTPSNAPKATIRMQLEAHATHAICASCHRKIDPLGFAFDNFDAVGRWRTEEAVPGGQGADPAVNASGVLADGRPFDGPGAFKRLLVQDLDRFAVAFVEQLSMYALRRVPTVDDAAQIHAVAASSKHDGYRLRTLLENFIASDLFQKR